MALAHMRTIVIGLLTASVVLLGSFKSPAQCRCEPSLSVKEQFQRSDAVFAGRVVETTKIRGKNNDEGGYDIVIKFEVTQAWKRDLEKFVTATELFGSTDGFDPGAQWLIYASKTGDGRLQITRDCCSRTKFLSDAKDDFRVFKKMREQPKKIIDEKHETTGARNSTSRVVGGRNVSNWLSLPGRDISLRFRKDGIKSTRIQVACDLLVPDLAVVLSEPVH